MCEVTEGNFVDSKRSSSTGMRTGLGRGEGLDLDVGAVDELLVGEYVVRARDKEEKNFTFVSPFGYPGGVLYTQYRSTGHSTQIFFAAS